MVVPPNRRSPQLSARQLSRQCGHHPGQLAPERLLARPLDRRQGHGRGGATAHRASQAAQPLAAVLASRPNARRPDGKTGWKGLRLRPDIVGTVDGLAKAPYVRESRRILAETTVIEQHVGTEARRKVRKAQEIQAEPFPDSVGLGSYRIDLHPSTGGDNYIDVSSLPFQIPLGALIPRRVENLLPACKNLGTTHIHKRLLSVASRRMEYRRGLPAALAAYCLEQQESPRSVRNKPQWLSAFQSRLVQQGVEIAWPRVTPR